MMKDISSMLMFNILKFYTNSIPFLPERMEIGKVERLFTNFCDKTEYVIHTRNLKQALNHGLVLINVHKGIKLKQNLAKAIYWYEHSVKTKSKK